MRFPLPVNARLRLRAAFSLTADPLFYSKTARMDPSCQVNLQSHMTAASREVAAWEGGRIINEHYNIEEYVKRRVHFLGKHPDYKDRSVGLFPIARRASEEIFHTDRLQLSVQEVRRRELANEVLPLLPLPTTENTATIDDFEGYPEGEYSVSAEMMDSSALTYPLQMMTGVHALIRSAETADGEPDTSDLAAPQLHAQPEANIAQASKTNPANHEQKAMSIPARLEANSTISQGQVPQMTTYNVANGLSNFSQVTTSSPASYMAEVAPSRTDGQPTSSSEQSMLQTAQSSAEYPPGNAALIRDIIAKLGTKPTPSIDTPTQPPTEALSTPQEASQEDEAVKGDEVLIKNITAKLGSKPQIPIYSPALPTTEAPSPAPEAAPQPDTTRRPHLSIPPGVSALASHGFNPGVKVRSGKRQREVTTVFGGTEETTKTSEHAVSAEPEVPPPKKPKLNVVLKLPNNRAPETEKRETRETRSKSEQKESKEAQASAFENIISGEVLPKTAAEARAAAEARYKRLLEKHQDAQKPTKTNRGKRARKSPDGAQDAPDLLPEFFVKEKIVDGMEDGSVRCICGAVVSDETLMVSCETCNVWQHIACMGDAVPKDLKNDDYYCHVCDPFLHRELVARLRRENPL